MPRRRLSWEEKRAAELKQEAQDRRFREQLLASEAEQPIQPTPEPSQEADSFDIARWDLNTRAASLMRRTYGEGWVSSPALQRFAQRVLADLAGHGDGRALSRVANLHQDGGSYARAVAFKFGDTLQQS